MSVLTVSALTQKAIAIKDILDSDKYDEGSSIEKLEELYEDGRQLVIKEIRHQQSKGDIYSPVMITLEEVAALPRIQQRVNVHRALSKTYRIFIELTWYRCWKQANRQVWKETKDSILKTAGQSIKALPKIEALDVKFEYSVAKEAAKCLTPADGMWKNTSIHSSPWLLLLRN